MTLCYSTFRLRLKNRITLMNRAASVLISFRLELEFINLCQIHFFQLSYRSQIIVCDINSLDGMAFQIPFFHWNSSKN